MFDLLFRPLATYRAVSDPGSSAPPRTTVAACKKNRTEIFVRRFSTSQLTDRSGATQEEQPNAPRHPLAKKSDGVGWSSLLSVATYRQVRCHGRRTTPQLFCDRRTDTRGPRPEQSRAKQKHEPRRKRKVIRGHTRDDAPQVLKRRAWKWTERDRAPTSDGATCDQGRAPHGNRTRACVKAARLKGRVTRRRMKGVRHLPGLATCLQQVASARNRRRQSGDART